MYYLVALCNVHYWGLAFSTSTLSSYWAAHLCNQLFNVLRNPLSNIFKTFFKELSVINLRYYLMIFGLIFVDVLLMNNNCAVLWQWKSYGRHYWQWKPVHRLVVLVWMFLLLDMCFLTLYLLSVSVIYLTNGYLIQILLNSTWLIYLRYLNRINPPQNHRTYVLFL